MRGKQIGHVEIGSIGYWDDQKQWGQRSANSLPIYIKDSKQPVLSIPTP